MHHFASTSIPLNCIKGFSNIGLSYFYYCIKIMTFRKDTEAWRSAFDEAAIRKFFEKNYSALVSYLLFKSYVGRVQYTFIRRKKS